MLLELCPRTYGDVLIAECFSAITKALVMVAIIGNRLLVRLCLSVVVSVSQLVKRVMIK